MDGMDRLPSKILVKIFSYLTHPQLLQAEQVCLQWQRVVQTCAWDGLTRIREETIGYPYDDYLDNFIRLAHRVREVKEFISPFELINEHLHSAQEVRTELRKDYLKHPYYIGSKLVPWKYYIFPFELLNEHFRTNFEMEIELKNATLQLAKKLVPKGVFPLDIVRYVTIAELKEKAKSMLISRPIVEATISQVMTESRVLKFKCIRISNLYVHSHHRDPFTVEWEGETFPVKLKESKITRLVVGCLVIQLLWVMRQEDAKKRSQAVLRRIFNFKRLKSVEIESVQMVMYPIWAGDEPMFDVTLHLHPDRRKFMRLDFECFLQKLTEADDLTRDYDLSDQVMAWKKTGRIKSAQVRAKNDVALQAGMETLCGSSLAEKESPYDIIIALAFPSVIDSLHIGYKKDSKKEDKLLPKFKNRGALSRLKSLSLSLLYDMDHGSKLRTWLPAMAIANSHTMLHTIVGSLQGLERLAFDVMAGDNGCLPEAFESTTRVTAPLPRLLHLEWLGMPCLPFIVSAVSHAANLRRLVVVARPFEDYTVGLTWTKTLVESLQHCSRVSRLQLYICSDSELSRIASGQRASPADEVDPTIKNLLNAIDASLRQLVSSSPSLLHVSVLVGKWDYVFLVDKHRKGNGEEWITEFAATFSTELDRD